MQDRLIEARLVQRWVAAVNALAAGAALALVCALPQAARGEDAEPGAPPAQTAPCVRGRELVSDQELQAQRAAAQAAGNEQERREVQMKFLATLRERASEKGKPLCHDMMGRRGGKGGMGMPPGMGKGGPPPGQEPQGD